MLVPLDFVPPMPRLQRGCPSRAVDFVCIDGNFVLLATCNSNNVFLQRPNRPTTVYSRHKRPVTSVRLFENSTEHEGGVVLVASGDDSGRVIVWEADELEKEPLLDAVCLDRVEDIVWGPGDSPFIVVLGRGKHSSHFILDLSSVSYFSHKSAAKRNKLLSETSLGGPTRDCRAAAIDEESVCVGCDDGVLYRYGQRPLTLTAVGRLGNGRITGVCMLTGSLAVCCTSDGTIAIMSPENKVIFRQDMFKSMATACVSTSGTSFAVSYVDGFVRLFKYAGLGIDLISEANCASDWPPLNSKNPVAQDQNCQVLGIVENNGLLACTLLNGRLISMDAGLNRIKCSFAHCCRITSLKLKQKSAAESALANLELSASSDGIIHRYELTNRGDLTGEESQIHPFSGRNTMQHPDEAVLAFARGQGGSDLVVGPRSVLNLLTGAVSAIPMAARVICDSTSNVYNLRRCPHTTGTLVEQLMFSAGPQSEALHSRKICSLPTIKDPDEIRMVERIGETPWFALVIGKGDSVTLVSSEGCSQSSPAGPVLLSHGVITCLAHAPVSDGKYYLASGDNQRRIYLAVFDAQSGHLESVSTRWCHHASTLSCLAFSPLTGILVSGGCDGAIGVWDPKQTDKPVGMQTRAHVGPISGMHFVSDSLLISRGSSDASLRLWGLNEREPVC